MVTCQVSPVPDEIKWEYRVLKAIEVSSAGARLVCQDDDGGWTFHVYCDDFWLLYLEPYAELLLASKQDLSVETPHVPVYADANGRFHFCPNGAEADYPYLRLERKFMMSGPWVRKRFNPASVLGQFVKKAT